jgi:NAD(P)-dependent dehydrogenase (short-subunit alcohol dehydrogenase family)
VARDQGGIDEAVAQIAEGGRTVIGISADLSTNDGVDAAVRSTAEAFGSPDIVVGQTNDMTFGSFNDVATDDYEKVFRIFTMSQIYLAKATIPAMREKKWGRYIHIGAMCGKEPQFTHPTIIHNTVRPSTVAFMRVLANEVAADGVTVNVVGPGLTMTPTLEGYIANGMGITKEQGREWLSGKMPEGVKNRQGLPNIPMKRAGLPHEIGGVVTFLASQYAGYVTGEWIAVDGGKHAFAF